MHPMSAEEPLTSATYRDAPGAQQDLIGVSRSMEFLMAALDELGQLVPQFEQRLSPVLVDGSNFASPNRLTETAPLRSGLAESIDLRGRQVQEVTDALRGILGRVDL